MIDARSALAARRHFGVRIAIAASIALGPALLGASHATTLGDIAAAMAAPAGAAQTTNEWSSFAKLKQTQWKGKAPARGGNKYYWNGSLPLDGLGAGEISLVGTQTTVTSATAGVQKKVELAKIAQLVAAQFPKDAKVEQVRGACPGEIMSGSRIYRVTLAGRKPLFVHAQSVTDDRSGVYSSFEFELERNKLWIC
jgi:hypothetical protein